MHGEPRQSDLWHCGSLIPARRTGRPRGAHGLLSAAARASIWTVVTADPAAFADLPGVATHNHRSRTRSYRCLVDRVRPIWLLALLGAKLGAIRCGRLWTPVELKAFRFGLCGRLWTRVDTAWRSTDQKVGDSSSPGRADVSCVSVMASIWVGSLS
jgi:hypothetical protein